MGSAALVEAVLYPARDDGVIKNKQTAKWKTAQCLFVWIVYSIPMDGAFDVLPFGVLCNEPMAVESKA